MRLTPIDSKRQFHLLILSDSIATLLYGSSGFHRYQSEIDRRRDSVWHPLWILDSSNIALKWLLSSLNHNPSLFRELLIYTKLSRLFSKRIKPNNHQQTQVLVKRLKWKIIDGKVPSIVAENIQIAASRHERSTKRVASDHPYRPDI